MKLARDKTISTLRGGERHANGFLCAALFARGLRERYVRRRNAWRAVYLLIRTASYGVMQQILNRREVHRNLVILRAPLASGVGMSSGAHADARERAPRSFSLTSHNQQDTPRKFGNRKLLWLDLVERHRRIEVSDVKGQRSTATRVSDEPISHMLPCVHPQTETSSMPLTVRAASEPARRPTRANNDAPGEGSDPAPAAYTASNARAPGSRPVTGVPEQDIERLADRVIGTIDRRIAAHRERLGRP